MNPQPQALQKLKPSFNWVAFPLSVGRWLTAHMLLVFIIWSLWLALEHIAFGPSSFVRLWDNADSQVPARIGLARLFAQGQFGLWNPQWAAGVDLLASGLNPLADILLYLAAPGWLANGLFMWLQRFLAAYFSYRLLKDSLGVGTLPAFFGGLVYSLFAQSIVVWQDLAGFTVDDTLITPGFPFVLWALGRIDLDRPYRAYALFAGLGFLVSITSYYYQTLFFLPIIFYWFWMVTPKGTLLFWKGMALFTAVWLASEIPILWSTALNSPLSHRADLIGQDGFNPFLGTWQSAFGLIIQTARENAILLVMILGGIFVSKGRDKVLLALVAPLGLFVVLFLLLPWISTVLQNYAPALSGFDLGRIRLFVPFLLVVSGAVGLNLIAQEWRLEFARSFGANFGRPVQGALIVFAVLMITWQSVGTKNQTFGSVSGGENFQAMFAHPDLRALAEKQEILSPFRVATVRANGLYPAFAWAYGLETVDAHLQLYPDRYRNYWAQVVWPLYSTDTEVFDTIRYYGNKTYLFSPSGGFPTDSDVRFRDYYDLDLLSLANVQYIVSGLPLADDDLSLFSVTGQDDKREAWHDQSRWGRLFGTLQGKQPPRKLYIYENAQVSPRVFMTESARFFDDSEQLLEALGRASVDDLRSTAYIHKDHQREVSLGGSESQPGKVSISFYSPGRILIESESNGPGILVISNSYSPYWRASVNDVDRTVFPVNHAFQGVYLEAGRHTVELRYDPPYGLGF